MTRVAVGWGLVSLMVLLSPGCSGGDDDSKPVFPGLEFEDDALDVGETWVGLPVTGTLRLRNTGLATAHLDAITVEGPGFDLPGPLPSEVPASSRVSFEIRFHPKEPGEASGLVRVEGAEGRLEAALTATGKPIPDCDDDNVCTEDTFNLKLGRCERRDAEGPCDNGSACTTNDRCHQGECVGEPVTCDDGNPCTRDLCESDAGCVARADPDACDDDNPCTADSCDPEMGCQHTPVEDGTVCAAGQAQCERYYACNAGLCEVVYVPDDTPCDDGSACTDDDVCVAGACGGTTIDCADGEECTVDACDPAVGCVHDPEPDGTACGQQGQCFFNTCSAGGCVSGLRADGTLCDDGHPCTEGDQCASGRCEGTRIDCDDGQSCSVDWCIDGNCTHEDVMNGVPCEPAGGADGPAFCVFGTCRPASDIPNGTSCLDGDPCTEDTFQDGACVGVWTERPAEILDWEAAWAGASGIAPLSDGLYVALDPDGVTLLRLDGGRLEPLEHVWANVGRLEGVTPLGSGRFAALRPAPDAAVVLFEYAEGGRYGKLAELPLANDIRHAHLAAIPQAAYVATVSGGFGGWTSELHVVDLANPAAPVVASTTPFDGDLDVAVTGDGARLLTLHGADGRLVARTLAASLAPVEVDAVQVSGDAGDRVFLDALGTRAVAVVRGAASDRGAVYDVGTLTPVGRTAIHVRAVTDLSFATDDVVAMGAYPLSQGTDPVCEAPRGGVQHTLRHTDGTLMARWWRPDPIGFAGIGGLVREGGRPGGRWSPVGALLLRVDPETLDVAPVEAVAQAPLGRIALGVFEGWTVGAAGVARMALTLDGLDAHGLDLTFREASDRPERAPALARVEGWTPGPWISLSPILAEAIPACTVPVPLTFDWWAVPWGPLATSDVPGVRHLEHTRVAGAAAGRYLHTAHVDYGDLVLAVWQPPAAADASPVLLGHVRVPGCDGPDPEILAVDADELGDFGTLVAATCDGHSERILVDTSDPAAPRVAARTVTASRPLAAAFRWNRLATLIPQPGRDASTLRVESIANPAQPVLLAEVEVPRARALVAFDWFAAYVAAEPAQPAPGAGGELVMVDVRRATPWVTHTALPQVPTSGLDRYELVVTGARAGAGILEPACGPEPQD